MNQGNTNNKKIELNTSFYSSKEVMKNYKTAGNRKPEPDSMSFRRDNVQTPVWRVH